MFPRKSYFSVALGLFLAAQLLVSGCSSDKSNSASANDLTGNWQFSLQNGSVSYSQSGFVLQSGKSLGGQFLLTGNCAGLGTAQGEMNGTKVSLTVNQPAQTVGLSGTATADGSSITGNYSILSSGCGSTEVGTWTAMRVKTLSGSFTGAFTSKSAAVAPFSFSGMLTQATNPGASQATLAGSMTSNNAVCFRDANITGLISGTSVILNLSTSDGMALGQVAGTASLDATSLTGTYDFFNAQTPIPGCPSGDSGTATLTIQPQP